MCNACPYLYSGNEAKQQPKIIDMSTEIKVSYRAMSYEKREEYKTFPLWQLLEKQANAQRNLNGLLMQLADPRTAADECGDTFNTIMWVRQEIAAIYWALKAKDTSN